MTTATRTRSTLRAITLGVWRPDQRKTVYLIGLIFAIGGFFASAYVQKTWHDYRLEDPGHPARFGDFFALWSYARIMAEHPASQLYDDTTLHARQVALGMDPDINNPFPYPPVFLLLIWPLRLLPYDIAYLAWTAGTLALFVWAIRTTCARSPFYWLVIVLAPVSTATISAGQSGFLAAALITAGLRLAPIRPLLSGLLIGVLSYKPQLGFLIPIGQAGAGLWSALFAAGATVIGLSLITSLIFGWHVWPAWLSMLPTYNENFDGTLVNLKIMPTLLANLRVLDCPLSTAQALQALAAIAVAVVVWRCFRRAPNRIAVAALLAGTFLATPHAFIYDMPMLTAAITLFIEERRDTTASFDTTEVIILVLAMIFPVFMVMPPINVPISALCLFLLFGLIVRTRPA